MPIADKISRVTDSTTGRPVVPTLSAPGHTAGGTSITISSATNWTTTTAIHFSIYTTTSVGGVLVKNTTSQTDWKGTLSGTTISNMLLKGGTDRDYSAGAIVEITPTAAWAKELYDWGITHADQDGTLKAEAVDVSAVLADDVVTAPKLSGIDRSNLTVDSNPYKFSAYRAAAHNSSSSATKITFDTELFDTNSNFDVATGRYTAAVAGFYYFSALAGNTAAVGTSMEIYLYKNGTLFKNGSSLVVGTASVSGTLLQLSVGPVQLAATDYVEIFFIGGSGSVMAVGAAKCYFDGYLISRT